jgi:hypothetical protein
VTSAVRGGALEFTIAEFLLVARRTFDVTDVTEMA